MTDKYIDLYIAKAWHNEDASILACIPKHLHKTIENIYAKAFEEGFNLGLNEGWALEQDWRRQYDEDR